MALRSFATIVKKLQYHFALTKSLQSYNGKQSINNSSRQSNRGKILRQSYDNLTIMTELL